MLILAIFTELGQNGAKHKQCATVCSTLQKMLMFINYTFLDSLFQNLSTMIQFKEAYEKSVCFFFFSATYYI